MNTCKNCTYFAKAFTLIETKLGTIKIIKHPCLDNSYKTEGLSIKFSKDIEDEFVGASDKFIKPYSYGDIVELLNYHSDNKIVQSNHWKVRYEHLFIQVNSMSFFDRLSFLFTGRINHNFEIIKIGKEKEDGK